MSVAITPQPYIEQVLCQAEVSLVKASSCKIDQEYRMVLLEFKHFQSLLLLAIVLLATALDTLKVHSIVIKQAFDEEEGRVDDYFDKVRDLGEV
jgi:hypothetical protein